MRLPDAVLSFDPARTGAAVLMALTVPASKKGTVLAVVPWKESTLKGIRGYRLLGEWVRTAGEVVALVWAHMAKVAYIHAASVEGMALPKKLGRGGKSERSLITLFEETGAMVDAVRLRGFEPERPTATVWRGKVLRIGYTARAKAEAYAMKCAPLLFEGEALVTIHEVEAGCMAIYLREIVRSR